MLAHWSMDSTGIARVGTVLYDFRSYLNSDYYVYTSTWCVGLCPASKHHVSFSTNSKAHLAAYCLGECMYFWCSPLQKVCQCPRTLTHCSVRFKQPCLPGGVEVIQSGSNSQACLVVWKLNCDGGSGEATRCWWPGLTGLRVSGFW